MLTESVSDRALLRQVKQQLRSPHWLEAPLEWLMEQLLPRRMLRITSTPLKAVKTMADADNVWLSEGNEPTFSWQLEGGWQPGWYYLEVALTRHNGSREARLEIPDHTGALPFVIPVSSNLRGSIREIFFLPRERPEIHWRPTCARGLFRQSPVAVHRISAVESVLRRAHRVMLDGLRFRQSKHPASRKLRLPNALKDLHAAYLAGTYLRLRRLSELDYQAVLGSQNKRQQQRFKLARDLLPKALACPVLVLVVVDSSGLSGLRALIHSLLAQSHAAWTMVCLSKTAEIERELALAELPQDARIAIWRDAPGGTSLASRLNATMARSPAEIMLWVEPRATLAPDALLHFVLEFLQHPQAQLAYCDEDTFEPAEQLRSAPLFKPDWNPELLQAFNYFGLCIALRKNTATTQREFREYFEGAELYDLLLRITANQSSEQVRHLSYVLAHQNTDVVAPGKHAMRARYTAERRALQSVLAFNGCVVEAGDAEALHHVRYPLPAEPPLISIIVPTRDRVELIQACIDSVLTKTRYPRWEMIIVDNDSIAPATHRFFEHAQQHPNVRVLSAPGAFNYSRLNNAAAAISQGEVLVLLNNDIEVIAEDWLDYLVSHALRPDVGAVGAKLLYPDNTIQHAGVAIGMGGVAGHVHRTLPGDAPGYLNRLLVTQEVSAVTGACVAIAKDKFERVGGLEEDLAVALNDIDLCLKLRQQGWRNIWEPRALLYHHESLSRGVNDTPAKKALWAFEFGYMKNKWAPLLARDPHWPMHDEPLLAGSVFLDV